MNGPDRLASLAQQRARVNRNQQRIEKALLRHRREKTALANFAAVVLLLRPSRTFKRQQPAARPRILHTRRHDQAERAQRRVLDQAA